MQATFDGVTLLIGAAACFGLHVATAAPLRRRYYQLTIRAAAARAIVFLAGASFLFVGVASTPP